MLPQLWKNNFGRAVSPPPLSPTLLESSPHYDRLLTELRHAQVLPHFLLNYLISLSLSLSLSLQMI